jgi:hypothetical protein
MLEKGKGGNKNGRELSNAWMSAGSVEFHELLGQVKEKFSDVIAEYETLIVYREYAPNPFRFFLEKRSARWGE